MDTSLMQLPFDQIDETMATTSQTLFPSDSAKCLAYLKNFDDYYILSIVNTENKLVNQHIKLPIKFVDSLDKTNYKELLDEFLKVTGVRMGNMDNQFITDFNRDKKQLHMHPNTYHGALVFGLENGSMVNFFFIYNVLKYHDFLKKHEIKSTPQACSL